MDSLVNGTPRTYAEFLAQPDIVRVVAELRESPIHSEKGIQLACMTTWANKLEITNQMLRERVAELEQKRTAADDFDRLHRQATSSMDECLECRECQTLVPSDEGAFDGDVFFCDGECMSRFYRRMEIGESEEETRTERAERLRLERQQIAEEANDDRLIGERREAARC
jgi:hypothetical protein